MWNYSRCIVHDWPHLFGFHMNVTEADVTDEMRVAVIHPSSPENVWAGDEGVPQTVHQYYEDGSYESIPNPDYNADSPGYDTVFLLFVDEDEAKALAPHLWTADYLTTEEEGTN